MKKIIVTLMIIASLLIKPLASGPYGSAGLEAVKETEEIEKPKVVKEVKPAKAVKKSKPAKAVKTAKTVKTVKKKATE